MYLYCCYEACQSHWPSFQKSLSVSRMYQTEVLECSAFRSQSLCFVEWH
uniref:Uncharacterized protein n=1 Tax=Anguilla anguilla TaxID=7936 RepID=A0A0E9WIK5_ANGAN